MQGQRLSFCFRTLKIRRLTNLSVSLWVLGVCCVILAFIAKDQKALILVFYLIGKSSVGVAFVVVWLITNETYPTNLRTQALGICSTVGENRKISTNVFMFFS